MITLETIKSVFKTKKKEPSVADFTQMVFPLIRSVMPTLVASQIVSVQPLGIPKNIKIKYVSGKTQNALYTIHHDDRLLYEICQYINRN